VVANTRHPSLLLLLLLALTDGVETTAAAGISIKWFRIHEDPSSSVHVPFHHTHTHTHIKSLLNFTTNGNYQS
jgi:hypothetical protein